MYCVLEMARRFAAPPAVIWLPHSVVQSRLRRIGNDYYEFLKIGRAHV